MDFQDAAQKIADNKKLFVKLAEWEDDWEDYYVIFADLIAFAQRCTFSTGVTLHSIVRFHRAINDALAGIESIIKYQFTDACYVLTKDPKTALIVMSNIQNECLVYNYALSKNLKRAMFYQMIVPKVVLSRGNVLVINKSEDVESLTKMAGISAKELLAGDGIVKAYYLEKRTTGGLASVDPKHIGALKKHGIENPKHNKTVSLYRKWQADASNKFLSHDGVIDIPWLALQPRQTKKGLLLIENPVSFKEKIKAFNFVWRANFTEHLAEGTSTETLKHYGGGISHLCELLKLYYDAGPRSWDLIDLNKAIDKL